MATVLNILKRYLFEILCGAGAVLGILLSLWGWHSMVGVRTEMAAGVTLHEDLVKMARANNPVNWPTVESDQSRIERIRRQYTQALDFVKELNAFPPLKPEAFPEADRDEKTAFCSAFQAEVRSWLSTLKAGDVPTEEDVRRAEQAAEADAGQDETLGGDSHQDPEKGGGTGYEKDANRERAEVLASLDRARSIYCYASAASFQESSISAPNGPMYSKQRLPEPEELWYAQLEVWIQRDVVAAVARINSAAADKLKAENATPWVGNLPVKEVVSIQTSEYYIIEQPVDPAGGGVAPKPPTGSERKSVDRAYPAGVAAASFTGGKCGPQYEVVQFSVRLVVDSRRLPTIISELCRDRFHIPIRVEYTSVPPNPTMKGHIYGDGPVIEVTIDFETVFFSELYLAMMPDPILKVIGKQRPQPQQQKADPGRGG